MHVYLTEYKMGSRLKELKGRRCVGLDKEKADNSKGMVVKSTLEEAEEFLILPL